MAPQGRQPVTMVVVAQRISTRAICDRIVVLEAGTIAAEGPAERMEETSAFPRRRRPPRPAGHRPVSDTSE